MSSLQHFPVKLEGIIFSMFFLGWFFVTFSCPVQKKRITSLENHNQLVLGFILLVFFVASKKSFRPPRYVPSPDLYCDFSHVEIHHLPRGGGNFGFQLEVVDG